MTTTFVNRQNTNHAVISKANETIKREGKNKKIKQFRQIYQDVKTKRLAKVPLLTFLCTPVSLRIQKTLLTTKRANMSLRLIEICLCIFRGSGLTLKPSIGKAVLHTSLVGKSSAATFYTEHA